MTNSELLTSIINEKGIKLSFLKDALNISYPTLKRKINNQSPFTAEEIDIICDKLNITSLKLKNDIFFYSWCWQIFNKRRHTMKMRDDPEYQKNYKKWLKEQERKWTSGQGEK